MKNGRGKAADTLPETEAVVVRKRLRQARDAMGLSNADLAAILGWKRGQIATDWTPQKVARVFDTTGERGRTKTSPRPLRAPNAWAVLTAILRAPAHGTAPDETALRKMRALRLANAAAFASRPLRKMWMRMMSGVGERPPEALLPVGEERRLAEFVVDHLPEHGYRPARREKAIAALDDLLKTYGGELAESAASVYRTRFRGWEQQRTREAELLGAFGYRKKR